LLLCVASEQDVPHAPQLPLSVPLVLTQAPPQSVGRVALGQLATQAVPEQTSVPFVGAAGQAAHVPPTPFTLPQRSVPAAQLLQTPPVQLVPVGQTWPQLPQLLLSVEVLTSQPVAGFLSQSALGALQTGFVHLPPTHPSTPPVMLHGIPQPPQLPTLVFVLISHPFAALLSQSAYPAAHAVMAQVEAVQLSVA
jgi:hypothetical protein